MKTPPDHRSQVFGTPWEGVHGTAMDSARHYGRHWHSTYGVGLLDHGAQSSASGRGKVDAYAGDLITTNPGEVHDGRPLGGPSRRWRMVYFDAAVMAGMLGGAAMDGSVEFTRPVLKDLRLVQTLRRLFTRLDDWRNCAASASASAEALACEESLVEVCGLLLGGHSTAVPQPEIDGDVRLVRERLADDLLAAPTLDELAAMAGLGKFQLLRRFQKAYGVPPYAWLLLQRAERARALIRRGTNLADTAAASGFADQSHMTRIFTRHFGFTPGAWQRA
ncbi:AraC-like DNA-binding protein [Variovorax boronicumulans]|uniref:AraC family transcriptional regulator n=1 Tax=Variovorax boronicumulans TaxID=436515 RepID=UPI002780F259|nr:AraC family transcriptional regulator [Variovorax boronicumulans]MDQ0084891.1 AraC-like DNA-binding protein [Variovorax boronicumulans]